MQSFYDLRRICTVSKTRENDSVTGWSSVERAGRVHGPLPGFTPRGHPGLTSMVYSQVYFHAILRAWLACDAGCLLWCKSVPIGTVFRSKRQKSTNLVRLSGFLVLLSRFVVGGQGIIPARRWIQEGGLGWIQDGSEGMELNPTREPDLPRNIIANMLQILAKSKEFTHPFIHPHPHLHILPW